jgi:hypothetical protein
MSYINAAEILPPELLVRIQEYTEGSLIYIPNKPCSRRSWGEGTRTRFLIRSRNLEIISDYLAGFPVRELALKYFLAESTVKKIVYNR